jgi:peptidoglycan-associated lipoprotein
MNMPKKLMTILAAVIFICIPLMFMSGCKGKGTQVSDESFTLARTAPQAQPARPARPDTDRQPAEELQARAGDKGGERPEGGGKGGEKGGKGRGRRDEPTFVSTGPSQAEIEAFEAASIFFNFDRSDLKPEARNLLYHKAAFLKNNKDLSVRISGHCDERGTNEYNMALGERRAEVAKRFLAALGVDSNRITTVSFGEERPRDPGHSEAAWSKNRRDEFEIIQ